MQDLNSSLAGCKVFSKLDLVKGYHQVPVATANVPKTVIITPFGLFLSTSSCPSASKTPPSPSSS